MSFEEYSQWMGIAAVVFFLGILVVSRFVRNLGTTKAKVQKGALIIGISVSAILLVWGVLYEVFR
jgi:hypothetical protein